MERDPATRQRHLRTRATATVLLVFAAAFAAMSPPALPQAGETLTFAAGGDIGANGRADASLASLNTLAPAFFLALGDLRYGQTPTDQAWCDYVGARLPSLGPAFPFQLLAGDQEQDGTADGNILQLSQCLPDRMGSSLGTTAQYAAEYLFDHPAAAPIVRVIMISPDLTIGGLKYKYRPGTARYDWVAAKIDEARARGIPWVIVGAHKPCINAANTSCSMGEALFNLLVGRKVDVILHGHAHNYQRSMQLALNPVTCPAFTRNTFDPDCVVDDGSDGSYVKGAGTVVVIAGTVGRSPSTITAQVAAAYFARIDTTSNGFVRYDVSTGRMDATFLASRGSFADAFSIVAGAPPDPGPSPTTLIVPVAADATIQENKPTGRFGTAATLEVDASARKDALLRFAVTGIGSAAVTNARLRMYNIDPSGAGGAVFGVDAPGWDEATVSWSSAPPAVGGALASFGAVAEGWHEVDVSGAVLGDGVVGFRMQTPSSNLAAYVSKEGTAGLAPVLVLTLV